MEIFFYDTKYKQIVTLCRFKKNNPQELHYYGKVKIINLYQDKLTLQLEQISSRIDWLTTSRLIFGSLVILHSSLENSFTFWTVQDRNFQNGVLEITIISDNQNQLLQSTFLKHLFFII